MNPQRITPLVALTLASLTLSACAANTSPQAADAKNIKVTITDTECTVPVTQVPSGQVTFTLENKGTVRNEFEILAKDKLRIVGERENLGPGTQTEYTVLLQPGTYFTACKTNMVGQLVGTKEFTVTDSGTPVELAKDEAAAREQAVTNYTAYVRDQVGQLLAATEEFAAAYKAGDFEKAKSLYALTRMYYERIEPTAEAFGDLDPALDEREADYQESGEADTRPWTGWHVAEKDLWRPAGYNGLSDAERAQIADGLVKDTKRLYDEVYSNEFKISLDDISNGAIGLLEEVATSKITGEEEAFSHTDLWDFQANVEGAKVAYGTVQDLAQKKDQQLTEKIDERFADLEDELAKHKVQDGYKYYNELSVEEQKALSDKVNALRKELAQLTKAVLS